MPPRPKKPTRSSTARRSPKGASDELQVRSDEGILQYLERFHESSQRIPLELLAETGVELLPAEALTDEEITEKLWEVIRGLAFLGIYLQSTNHLSDRELYEMLVGELLLEETLVMPGDPEFACNLDLVGSGSDADVDRWLRYYADQETREDWASQWPDYQMPERATPPFDRDRYLPSRESSMRATMRDVN